VIRTPVSRASALSVGLVVAVVVAWFPGLLRGHVITVADALFARAPWQASAPPGWSGPANKLLFDQVVQVYPWADYARARLRRGELPLWNPHDACGTPFLANQNAGLFSPLHLPLWLAPDTATGLTLVAIAKLILAAWGAYALARTLDASVASARIGAAIYGLGAQSIVWLGHPLTTASPFLPWSLVAAERLVDVDGRRPGAIVALALATGAHMLGGHPETSLHIVVVTTLWITWRSLTRGRRGPLLTTLAGGAAGIAIGIALSGVQLAPFAAALSESHARVMRRATPTDFRLRPGVAPLALVPRAYGTPMDLNHREDLSATNFAESALFVGVLPLLLVPATLPALGRDRRLRLLAAIGLGGLLIAFDVFGIATGGLEAVPLIGLGAHHRLTLLWTLAMAVLAARAVDALADRERPTSTVATGLAVIVCLGLIAWGLTRAQAAGSLHLRAILFAGGAAMLVAASVALIAHRSRVRAATLAGIVLSLVLADLWMFGHDINPTLARDRVFPSTPSIEHMRAGGGRFIALERALPTNAGLVYGLDDARGYEPLFSRHYQQVWHEAVAPGGAWEIFSWHDLLAPQVLRLLGVRHVLTGPDAAPLDPRGLAIARHDLADATVWELHDPLPFAFVRHAIDEEHDAARAGARLAGGYPFDERVLLANPLAGALGSARAASEVAPPTGVETIRLRRPRPERIEVETDLTSPGVVVAMESWDPGWRLRGAPDRGRPYRAYGAFLAALVPAGHHVTIFEYRPQLMGVGLISTAIGVASLLGLAIVGRRQRGATP